MGETEIRELKLYINTDRDIYRTYKVPIIKNLVRKKKKGIYSSAKAPRIFMSMINVGAKKYAREFARPEEWNKIFSASDRKKLAKEYAEEFDREYKINQYEGI